MQKLILIKYGELTTKKDNRKVFIKCLYNNIFNKLKDYHVNIIDNHSRMYIEYEDFDEEKIINVLKNTFGIHAFSVAYKISTDIEDIKNKVLEILNNETFKTFKVETKRSDKNYPIKSMDVSKLIGGHILKNIKDLKVDVKNPDVFVNIEIQVNAAYIYLKDYKGIGGYPVGVGGSGLLMLSGGIDSPVAGYLTMKRGVKLDCIYFEAIPHTSLNAREKVINLCHKLHKYSDDFNLYIVPITKLQEEIYKNCDSEYIITILRRMMYRIGFLVAKNIKAKILVNGESIGQVASQTLQSMNVINEVVNIPVIRPVVCFDKLEIIDIAKKIDTYEISILPYEDCCTVFVPRHPIINPRHDKCIELEAKIDYEPLINDAIANIKKITITNEDEFERLL